MISVDMDAESSDALSIAFYKCIEGRLQALEGPELYCGELDTIIQNLDLQERGFTTGDPSSTVEFSYTFTEDDTTHYYLSIPNTLAGMVGKITVGNGTTEDIVPEELIPESGLPGFGLGVVVLVLVGAAGLRRRIH